MLYNSFLHDTMSRREASDRKSVTVIDSHGQPITFLIQPNEELPRYEEAILQQNFSPAPSSNEPEERTPLLPAAAPVSLTVVQNIKLYFSPLFNKAYWKSVVYLLVWNFPLHLLVWLLACVLYQSFKAQLIDVL